MPIDKGSPILGNLISFIFIPLQKHSRIVRKVFMKTMQVALGFIPQSRITKAKARKLLLRGQHHISTSSKNCNRFHTNQIKLLETKMFLSL